MTFAELKDKALSLPLEPGVYIMQDAAKEVIYVGKAKKLKNRVSQYFVDSAGHSPKTRLMVSKIDHFDVIVAASEFEALVLECSLIKRYMPKYNILLKDDKGYPYLRLDLRQPYPVLTLSSSAPEDGAKYFGPYGGRYVTQKAMDTLRLIFKLPGCNKTFPRDIGKERPCLNFQLNNCDGWCRGEPGGGEYRRRMEQIAQLLRGDYKQVAAALGEEMEAAAERLEFERAAALRDRKNAIASLGQKQLVTAGRMADTDAIGYYEGAAKGCFVALHYMDGNLVHKDVSLVGTTGNQAEALSALVKQYYLGRAAAPRQILLPQEMEDGPLFAQMLSQQLKKKVTIRVPQRGAGAKMVALANKNAQEEAERVTTKEERLNGTLRLLQQLLGLPQLPRRLESFDISHIDGTDIVASMVVFQDGKPLKRDYRLFQLQGMDNQDDYGAMRQVLRRRFTRYLAQDKGFSQPPDVLLIDGGAAHAQAVVRELEKLELRLPTYGMVKDNRHRTRALVTPEGEEIGIAAHQSLFALIGNIQEETHRFAITYHRKLRSKRLHHSSLDAIPGIGPKRKQLLLRRFKTISAIKSASLNELAQVLPRDAAMAVYTAFHPQEERPESASDSGSVRRETQ